MSTTMTLSCTVNSAKLFRQSPTRSLNLPRAGTSLPRRASTLVVKAIQEPEQQTAYNTVQNARRNIDTMFRKYDFVSAGLGALCVTTFCVSRGQDPATAMWITAASTVVALVVNDSFFNDS